MEFNTSDIVKRFVAANPKSAAHNVRARKVVPGGTSRATMLQAPFPVYLADAGGAWVIDLDGNQRLDLNNNMCAMIHGHAHPVIVAAVKEQIEHMSASTSVSMREAELAETMCARVASIEKIVFNNSGTEAVMVAIRAARAFTGRNLIARFEGGYHGFYDPVLIGAFSVPDVDADTSAHKPVRDMAGMPAGVTDDAILLPYNDPAAVVEAFRTYGDKLAAIIVEPMLGAGGMIPATPEFLQTIRDESARSGTVMICDEVITLRAATGGAQSTYGITPDLTTMGKIIGGGYPVGAIGGRAEIMDVFLPPSEGGSVMFMGTFNSNPVTVAAGLATLDLLDEAAITRLNGLGERMRTGFRASIEQRQVPAQVTGASSCIDIHFTRREVRSTRDVNTADATLQQICCLGLANHGVVLPGARKGALSTAMTEADVDQAISCLDVTLDEMAAEGWFA